MFHCAAEKCYPHGSPKTIQREGTGGSVRRLDGVNGHHTLPDPSQVRAALARAELQPEDGLRTASVNINATLTELRGAPLTAAVPVNDTRTQIWEISRDGRRAVLASRDGVWTISAGKDHPLVEPAWVGPPTTANPGDLIDFCNDILSGDPTRQAAWPLRPALPPGV